MNRRMSRSAGAREEPMTESRQTTHFLGLRTAKYTARGLAAKAWYAEVE